MRDYDDLGFRRGLLGERKATDVKVLVEQTYPLPWKVRPNQVTYGQAQGERIFVILDSGDRFVAECDSESVANFIVTCCTKGLA